MTPASDSELASVSAVGVGVGVVGVGVGLAWVQPWLLQLRWLLA